MSNRPTVGGTQYVRSHHRALLYRSFEDASFPPRFDADDFIGIKYSHGYIMSFFASVDNLTRAVTDFAVTTVTRIRGKPKLDLARWGMGKPVRKDFSGAISSIFYVSVKKTFQTAASQPMKTRVDFQ